MLEELVIYSIFFAWRTLRLGVRKNVTQSRKARKEEVNPAKDRPFLSLYPERILETFAPWRENVFYRKDRPRKSAFSSVKSLPRMAEEGEKQGRGKVHVLIPEK